MFNLKFALFFGVPVSLLSVANAETHTVQFFNGCDTGTPILVQNGTILSTGVEYTIDGPLISAIAYLQTGSCGLSGEGCTVVETTLENGVPSTTYISLIPPYAFSVTTGFGYYNGCEGEGADCTFAECPAAATPSDQIYKQVVCTADNVNLEVTFCD